MKKSRILSILLVVLLSFTLVGSMLGCSCSSKKSFTVTFVGGDGAVLVSGKAVQTVTDASQIQPPVFEKPGYAFDSWSLILGDIKEDATVEAIWYSGYRMVLSRRFINVDRNESVTVGYSPMRGDNVKVPYGSKLGALDTLFPEPVVLHEDYEFLRWELVLENGVSVVLTEETVFDDSFFVNLSMSEEQAFDMRGKTFTVNPILRFVGQYAPLD